MAGERRPARFSDSWALVTRVMQPMNQSKILRRPSSTGVEAFQPRPAPLLVAWYRRSCVSGLPFFVEMQMSASALSLPILATPPGGSAWSLSCLWRAGRSSAHVLTPSSFLRWVPENLAVDFRKFWPVPGMMAPGLVQVKLRVPGAIVGAAQLDQAAPLQHPVEDGLGQVGVVQDPGPGVSGGIESSRAS